jgi:nitrite reductase/ring-hydroxylating ferredoxin subunit
MSREPDSSCGTCDLSRRSFVQSAAALAAAMAGLPPLLRGEVPRLIQPGNSGPEKSYPIPPSDGVSIDKTNEVILVRHAGHVFAFALSCPHQHTALRWVNDDGGRFECPKHHSKYQADGVFVSGRATRSMDRLPIRREGDEVLIDVDRMIRQDQAPAEWESAFVTV